ncbi:ATP-binding protein [Spiribacter halobius]|uniref:ATP-binding protein n=1 Tax=Sediminicurvatus halobius TaxID=2182432 RepID=UPI0011B23D15|nr:ATP-binding protein [Spiribacter halobius]UEX76525.1 response regulator [Spiribacter halobius]
MSARAWTTLARPRRRPLAELPWRLRCRLAVMLPAGGLALALVVFAVLAERAAVTATLEHRVDAASRAWALAAADTGAERSAGALVADLTTHPLIAEARVLDAGGNLAAREIRRGRPSASHFARVLGLVPDTLLASLPRGEAPAWRLVLVPAADGALARVLSAATPPVLIAALLLALAAWLAHRLERRLDNGLARVAEQLAALEAGALETRLQPLRGPFGDLEERLNRMASALEASRRSLRAQVQSTTGELRATLEAVEVQNAELESARQRALEASQVKSEFLANVSHEIRTPINGIVGFADLLAHSPLDAEQRDYVDTIRESCRHLLTIVNDILDFSKIEAGKLVIDHIALDLRDTVEEVLSLLAPAAYGKGLELVHLIYSDVPLKLYGDPLRIRQVLTNLVHNAIKFTPSGRIVVRVMLDEELEGAVRLRITVTDTGIGLSERDQARLFRGFSQADTSLTRRFGGTGLGLIISRKLLEQMGGEIGLQSREGEGTTFWFTLTLPRVSGGDEGEAWISPLAGRQVLLLDEEPMPRLASRHLLEGWDLEVTEAEERRSFLSLATASRRWDLLVIGLSRPQLREGLARGLFPRLAGQRAPVLVLASTVDRSELRMLRQQGAAGALPRAVRRQTVYRELCRLLESSPAEAGRKATAPQAPAADSSHVLVVDDHAVNRKLVTTIARQLGARVAEAADGRQAVDACARERFDVVFMDIQMPGMSGEAAAVEIRRRHGTAAPRLVALTANALRGERERLLAAGMDGCLIKPVTTAEVAAALGRSGADEAADIRLDALREALQAELPAHQQALRAAYRSGDHERLAAECHRLLGAARSCRLATLGAACERAERAVRAEDRVAIPGAIAAVQAAIRDCLTVDPAAGRAS